jgi:hypothetical protein
MIALSKYNTKMCKVTREERNRARTLQMGSSAVAPAQPDADGGASPGDEVASLWLSSVLAEAELTTLKEAHRNVLQKAKVLNETVNCANNYLSPPPEQT